VQLRGETLPVSESYREAFDRHFSRWK
jgi:hypothetical protein